MTIKIEVKQEVAQEAAHFIEKFQKREKIIIEGREYVITKIHSNTMCGTTVTCEPFREYKAAKST